MVMRGMNNVVMVMRRGCRCGVRGVGNDWCVFLSVEVAVDVMMVSASTLMFVLMGKENEGGVRMVSLVEMVMMADFGAFGASRTRTKRRSSPIMSLTVHFALFLFDAPTLFRPL